MRKEECFFDIPHIQPFTYFKTILVRIFLSYYGLKSLPFEKNNFATFLYLRYKSKLETNGLTAMNNGGN